MSENKSMNIPAEAVRVVEEHLRFYVDRPGTDWTVEATSILEAVGPHLLRDVWDEAYGKGFEAARGESDTPNPYEAAL